jgi:hypothetical protein
VYYYTCPATKLESKEGSMEFAILSLKIFGVIAGILLILAIVALVFFYVVAVKFHIDMYKYDYEGDRK